MGKACGKGMGINMLQNKEKNFVSCVVYLHNESDSVQNFLGQVCRVMQEHFEKYEVVCVNDGCTDNTIEQVRAFSAESRQNPVVSLVNLSYYQGVECAMNAGCDLAVGDFLFEFDSCRLDYEPSLIMEVYHRALQGYDVVAAAPRHGVSFTSRLFYAVYNWGSRYQAKIRQERFRVVSRRAVNRVNQMNTYVPYRKAMYMNSGLKTDTIVYDNLKEAAGRSRNREERGSRSTLAADTIIIFTNVLEKLSMTVSAVLLGALVIMFVYLIWSIFSKVRPVEGWLSIMMLMAFGFFMMSIMLTLVLKYLSVLLNMGFKKQRYVIEGVEKLTQ